VKFANQAFHDGEQKFYVLPGATDLKDIASLMSNSGRKVDTFKSFIDSNKQITRVSIQMADVGSIRIKELVKEIKPKVDSIFPKEKYDVNITGTSIMFLKGNDYLIKNLKESVIFASVLIALVMLLLFSSVRMVFISLLPSVVALMITAAIMGFMGIPLKPSTILVFGITLGIASDGNMYFMTKYRQELKLNHFSISKTVSKTIAETGISMIYTAFILFFGFGIFAASDFGGTAALGYLISVTLLVAYCSNLILLPCFLLSLEKRLISKAFVSEPLVEIWDEEEDIELDELKIKTDNTEN
jgi:predicted RND superfamily exporter protein